MFSCCSKMSAEMQPLLPSGEEVPVVVNRKVLTTFAALQQKSFLTLTSQHANDVHILAGLEGIIDRAESVAAERAEKRAAERAELVNARDEARAAARAELVAARAKLVAARAELVKARAAERAEKEEARRRRK